MDPTESERSGSSAEELQALRRENRELKSRLDRIDAQRQAKREVRNKGLRIGWGVLVPILDRQRVVRSFGELSNQVIRLADPNDQPEAREVAESAREFLSNCVRFAIRRRLFFAVFALIAAAVPAIQLWLVMQQNEIIQKQNDFFQIQVYEIVADSMLSSDADGEKRKITGLLLANADPGFRYEIVNEIFDPDAVTTFQLGGGARDNLRAVSYRGPLLRSLARGLVLQRSEQEDEEIYTQARPSLERVYEEAAERVPQVLKWSRETSSVGADAAVHYYLEQIGQVLLVHAQLARAVDKIDEFYAAAAPLFAGLARVRAGSGSTLDDSLFISLEPFLIDLAVETEFGAPERSPDDKDLKVKKVDGLQRLQAGLQKHNVDVAQLTAFVGASDQ